MKNNIVKTIEELSLVKTSGDLWDEFNQDKSTSSSLLYLNSNSKITLRMLGPFIKISRFYAPFTKYIKGSQISIEDIANKNPTAIQKAIEFMSSNISKVDKRYAFADTSSLQALQYLKEIDKKFTWQKCIMVNVYIRNGNPVGDSHLKMLILTKMMMDSIMSVAMNNPNAILSGLYAHDISITKKGEALQTRFEVSLSPPNHLPEDDVNCIIGTGLTDIPSLLEELNRGKGSYYYKKTTNYKMPVEFTKALLEERSHLEEDRHLIDTEEHLNEIPPEAFEHRNNMREAIGSLEV